MKQIARFEKVSVDEYVRSRARNQFGKDKPSDDKWYRQCLDAYRAEWEKIQLPTRATEGSAGYDFFVPGHYHIYDDFSGLGDSNITICTGIRALIDPGYVLMLYPRSGLGFKYGVRLINTTGIIDSDYSNSRNEGHIMVKLRSEKELDFNQGDRFIQGVFLPYGITHDDSATKSRSGGFGSTGS